MSTRPPAEARRDAQGRALCTARRRNTDDLCKAPAMAGTNVCRLHGGLAPQVKAKARLRLLELVDPAIATLAREMVSADASGDRQKAANSILDRAGYARMSRIEAVDAREVLIQRLLDLRAQWEAEDAEQS